MPKKSKANQAITRRKPQQKRSLEKIELILEAAMRLIERAGSVEALTTKAIAEKAGVSIGTLYQYFDDKQAILKELIDREMGGLGARVMEAIKTAPPDVLGGRIPALVSAVLSSYGGRRDVHRILLEYSLSRGPGTRLNALIQMMTAMLASQGVTTKNAPIKVRQADAFVLTYAFHGVMRGFIAGGTHNIQRHEVEEALTRMMVSFVKSAA